MYIKPNLKSVFLGLIGTVFLIGCDTRPDVAEIVGKANKSNVQKVANSLYIYQSANGEAPKNEEELCDFIANNNDINEKLSLMKIDKSAFRDHLISERDGEPFFVRYGVMIPYGARIPLVLEAVGVDGSRQVCWSDTKVTEVTDEKQYKRLKAGKVKAKSAIPEASGKTTE